MELLSDVMFLREATTVGAFGLFIAIFMWAYSRNRKAEFDEVSDFVIQDDDTLGALGVSK